MFTDTPASSFSEPIRVLIVDDHPVVRRGLRGLLESETDITCCGEAEQILTATELFDQQRPNVVLVDLNLGDEDGLQLLKYLSRRWIGARALVISQREPRLYGHLAREAGAMGYVHKEASADQVVDAVRHVSEGHVYFPDVD